jgi:diguanylate cyclase (GGDEF)-like protein
MYDVLVDIVSLCLSLDRRAADIFSRLASDAGPEELRVFWKEVSEDEEEHVDFWKKLLPLAEDRMLPQVFDDPERTRAELQEISARVDQLLEKYESSLSTRASFLLASKMEYYMLHPAFETLFYFMDRLSGKNGAEENYQRHLDKFVSMFRKYEDSSPELLLIGKTLRRLWRSNHQIVSQPSMDEVTGILNRKGFFNVIRPLLYLAQRNRYNVGFLIVDIDNLGKVYEERGSEAGDRALKTVAHILRSRIRISDVVARYGKEDFIIFFPEVLRDSIFSVAEKIRAIVGMETAGSIPVTVSLGASCGVLERKAEEGAMSLIKEASACLYTSKSTGKNKVTISSTH